ncbi:MAG TPA: hypothetical protein VKF41_12050 [Bryobacteraceae bacterium]|nr:hypothetical protein [Bryobacteraceae bacterium]
MGSENQASQPLSRRAFGWRLAGAVLARACAAAEPDQPGRLVWSAEPAPKLSLERRYRADAQVLLFGLTLLRREDVGGGSVLWREYETGGAARLLEFNGYSTPARAAGLNRLGFIREMARTAGSEMPECSYFGLMTASPEESAEAARKALSSGAKEQVYTAIEARLAPGETETAIAHFTAPAALSGANREELVERARRALTSVAEVRTAGPANEIGHSFLQELARLLIEADGKEGRFIYSGRPYRLHLIRSVDAKATAYFRARRLIGGPAEVVRVAGRLRREAGGKETEFRLWIPSGAERPLPLRIEYQAKSYLRLVFEAAAG